MKTTRIDVEGRLGKAVIFRSDQDIVINLVGRTEAGDRTIRRGIGHEDSWLVPARPTAKELRWQAARRLQKTLTGQPGTQGDIQDYMAAIETFAD